MTGLTSTSPLRSGAAAAAPESFKPVLESLDQTNAALALYVADRSSVPAWERLLAAVRGLARDVAACEDQPSAAVVEGLTGLVGRLGGDDIPARLAAAYQPAGPAADKNWRGVAVRMIQAPAWAAGALPKVERVPEWLQPAYVGWRLAVPARFHAVGQADRFAQYWEESLGELVSLVESRRLPRLGESILDLYQATDAEQPLRASNSDLRRIADMHARLLSARPAGPVDVLAPILLGREGRRLRIGFVVEALDGSAAMQAALPLMTQLDAERFDVTVFVQAELDNAWSRHVARSVTQLVTLPEVFSRQAMMISQGGFDVLVYTGSLTLNQGGALPLAALRLAPLQVASAAGQYAGTGAAQIDMLALGEDSLAEGLAAQFAERLACLPGPARGFDLVTGSAEPTADWSRAMFNLRDDELVFTAVAKVWQVTPETCEAWASALAACPAARLLCVIEGEHLDEAALAGCCAAFDRALAARQLASDRLMVVPAAGSSAVDIARLAELGDLFLATLGSGEEDRAVAALKGGVPVLTLAGRTWRAQRLAAILRRADLGSLVASTVESYVRAVAEWGADAALRDALRAKVRQAAVVLPACDTLAAGDAFGDLLESAFDELTQLGRSAFRTRKSPVRISGGDATRLPAAEDAIRQGDHFVALAEARTVLRAAPHDLRARAALGRAYLGLDQHARAVDYLLAVVESGQADAACWFDLATALHRSNRNEQAVQALEIALRLDPAHQDAWVMLADLAERCGMTDLARDAVGVLATLAPDHPRLSDLNARLSTDAGAAIATVNA